MPVPSQFKKATVPPPRVGKKVLAQKVPKKAAIVAALQSSAGKKRPKKPNPFAKKSATKKKAPAKKAGMTGKKPKPNPFANDADEHDYR